MRATLREYKPKGRVIAVSDVHGNLALLRRLLGRVGFAHGDTLVFVGDMTERGADSLGTLRLLAALEREARAVCLLGNTDAMQLAAVDSGAPVWGLPPREYIRLRPDWLLGQMCAEAGLDAASLPEEALRAALAARFADEFAFLRGLPTILTAGRWLFVHGGLPSPDLTEVLAGEAWPCMKFDAYFDRAVARDGWQVVGHWPATLYSAAHPNANPAVDRARRLVDLDGGCGIKPDAQLNALVIPDVAAEDFAFSSVDDLPTFTAADAQRTGGGSIHIRWGDCAVRIVSDEGDCPLCEHLSTGARLRIPRTLLWEEEGRLLTDDISDHNLPVRPGDTLSLVLATSHGRLCKKDGVTGWYFGA